MSAQQADLVLQNALCTLLERQDQWQRPARIVLLFALGEVAGEFYRF